MLRAVRKIIDKFDFIIEKRRLSEELYYQGKPRPEKAAQRIFFAIADAYCDANNLDLTPEADTGNGPVDFKVSKGKAARVLVEIKLSTNSAVISGYEKQLAAYDEAEESIHSHYVVLDVGKMGEKYERLLELRNERITKKIARSRHRRDRRNSETVSQQALANQFLKLQRDQAYLNIADPTSPPATTR